MHIVQSQLRDVLNSIKSDTREQISFISASIPHVTSSTPRKRATSARNHQLQPRPVSNEPTPRTSRRRIPGTPKEELNWLHELRRI